MEQLKNLRDIGWELASWDVQSSLLLFQATTSYSLAQKCLKVHLSNVRLFASCSAATLKLKACPNISIYLGSIQTHMFLGQLSTFFTRAHIRVARTNVSALKPPLPPEQTPPAPLLHTYKTHMQQLGEDLPLSINSNMLATASRQTGTLACHPQHSHALRYRIYKHV